MKAYLLLLSTLVNGASSFGVVPASRTAPRSSHTGLSAQIPVEEMSSDQLEIKKIAEKWSEVRHLTKEEAASQLEGDWLEAYNRFYETYESDMTKMKDIATMLQKQIEPPKIAKKSKGQKKRDKWAKVQELAAARTAAAKN